MKITKRKLFTLHSWLGLVAGIFILAICLSGAFAALIKEYEKSFEGKTVLVDVLDKYLPYDSLFAIAKEQVPDFHLYDYARLPQEKNEALEILYFPDGSYHSVFIDPYTGEVKGKLALNLSRWLLKFHWSFFIGSQGYVGAWIAFLVALCLLTSVVTGFIIYRKHIIDALLFRIKIRTASGKISSGLHRLVGVWSMLFLFITFGSGAYINYHIINGDFSYPGGEKLTREPKQLLSISIDNCLKQIKDTIPDLIPTGLFFPQLEGGDISISGKLKNQNTFIYSGTSVRFDARTGKLLSINNGIKESNTFSKTENIIYNLHYATYGGLFIKILYSVLALISGLMPITGFVLWRRRTKRKRKNGI